METASGLFFNTLIIIFLLLANAFFVASEFAIVGVRKTRISQLANDGLADAKLAVKSIDEMDKSIAAIQLGITISSIGLGWVGESTLVGFLDPLFAALPETFQGFATHSLAVAIAFAAITMLHVIIGELMPKSIALQCPEKTTLFVAKPLRAIIKIFTPFVFILNGIGNWLLSLLKISPASKSHLVHSVEELDMIIAASHKGGVLNDTEKEILQNVFKFSDTLAKQVMVPRPDMVTIPVNSTADEVNNIILESQYTRYPVYDEDMEHIIGILHVKDIYPLLVSDKTLNMRSILREAILVPETITMDNIMPEFKSKKSQMAIVIDEFGGVSGLITVEDVLEEIFGEVQDEFDEEEANIRQIYENEYVANAMMRIDEFNEFFGTVFEDEDCDTIGGLVVKQLGHIAKEGEATQLENFTFEVLETDVARIVKIKIKREKIDLENICDP
ncbi:CBS domain pair family protein [Candidatus Gastranaerophilus sp. (ex Termes propinquus)]|nr:CBS domain pair family protein [Candidatus Gastranaerophilus sp. (ex Termes propinquus)]